MVTMQHSVALDRRLGRLSLAHARWVAVAASVLASTAGPAQGGPVPAETADRSEALQTFVLIFRQGPVELSEADKLRRSEEVRSWGLRQIDEGRKLDPRILGEESYQIGRDGRGVPAGNGGDGTLVAITFVEARDFAEAIRIADSHPGPAFGVSVEVRAWTSPLARAPSP